jgi:hypothetical protein
MEKLTIREYATKHKLSTFNVVKMTRSGELQTETIEKDGKEILLICIDEVMEKEVSKKIEKKRESRGLRAENLMLKKEIVRLKEALENCKNRSKST